MTKRYIVLQRNGPIIDSFDDEVEADIFRSFLEDTTDVFREYKWVRPAQYSVYDTESYWDCSGEHMKAAALFSKNATKANKELADKYFRKEND